jgi:hypothetical protein
VTTKKIKPKTPTKRQHLTDKQHAFVYWYCSAAVNLNATEAARRAGYKGKENTLAQMGAENLRKPQIRQEIDKRLETALSGADVTVESVLRRLSVIGDKAMEAEQYSPAAKCAELHGKYLKMFTDRIEHVSTIEDVSTEELIHLLKEVVEAGSIDLAELITRHGPADSGIPDPPGTPTTH